MLVPGKMSFKSLADPRNKQCWFEGDCPFYFVFCNVTLKLTLLKGVAAKIYVSKIKIYSFLPPSTLKNDNFAERFCEHYILTQ